MSVADELRKLAELLREGLITREEFDQQKAALLGTARDRPGELRRNSGTPPDARRLPRWLWIVVLAAAGLALIVAALIVVRFTILEPYRVPSGSMEPTIQRRDLVWAHLRVTPAELERGDIIVFGHPNDPGISYIKRVVGLPGDKVELRAGVPIVNGQAYLQTLIGNYEYSSQAGMQAHALQITEDNGARRYQILHEDDEITNVHLSPFGPVMVRPDHLFVLGDNRANSSDSRHFGQVPFENLVGRLSQRN